MRLEGAIKVKLSNTSIVSEYILPNIDEQEYLEKTEVIEEMPGLPGEENLILAGDLNAKSTAWGGQVTKRREEVLET